MRCEHGIARTTISGGFEQADLDMVPDPQTVQEASGQLPKISATVLLAEVGCGSADQPANRAGRVCRAVKVSIG